MKCRYCSLSPSGQSYNIERQSDPGLPVDLDSSLASMDSLEFCLVREHSKLLDSIRILFVTLNLKKMALYSNLSIRPFQGIIILSTR